MKTFVLTLAGLSLAFTPAFAASSITASGATIQAPAGAARTVEILSGGRVVATISLPSGSAAFQADRLTYNKATGSMTLTGHVSVSVTQGGQPLMHLNADEVRWGVPPSKGAAGPTP